MSKPAIKILKLAAFGVCSFVILMSTVAALNWNSWRPLFIGLIVDKTAYAEKISDPSNDKSPRILFVGSDQLRNFKVPYVVCLLGKQTPGHDLPEVCQLLDSQSTLENHLKTGRYQELISSKKWNYVFLEEQLGRAIAEPNEMNKAAKSMIEAAINNGAKVFLIEPASSRENQNEQLRIDENLTQLARETGAQVLRTGGCIHEMAKSEPDLRAYTPNDLMPSDHGSYLMAVMIANTVFGETHAGDMTLPISVDTLIGPQPIIYLSMDEAERIHRRALNCAALETSTKEKGLESPGSDNPRSPSPQEPSSR